MLRVFSLRRGRTVCRSRRTRGSGAHGLAHRARRRTRSVCRRHRYRRGLWIGQTPADIRRPGRADRCRPRGRRGPVDARAGPEPSARGRCHRPSLADARGCPSVGCRPISATEALREAGFGIQSVERLRRGAVWPVAGVTCGVSRPRSGVHRRSRQRSVARRHPGRYWDRPGRAQRGSVCRR